MNRLSLRNNRLKFETSGNLLIISDESLTEYTSKEYKRQNWKISTSVPGKLFGHLESVKILMMILNPTGGYMFTSSGFDASIPLRYIL